MPGVQVTLRTPEGPVLQFPSQVHLRKVALKWAYYVGNRRRWSAGGPDQKEQSQRSAAELTELGVTEVMLQQLAKAGLVEVSIPYVREEQGWEARIFPWEFILSAATKPYRGEIPLTVVRHLDRVGLVSMLGPRPPRQFMFI